jgi:hypothetical protein
MKFYVHVEKIRIQASEYQLYGCQECPTAVQNLIDGAQ